MDVKVKLWSMNETRRFAYWLRELKGKTIKITKVRMNQNDCAVEVHYEEIKENERECKEFEANQ